MSELFDLLKRRLDGDMLGAIAGRLGLGRDASDTAVATSLPALLGGMAEHARIPAGADAILSRVEATGGGATLDGLLDRVRSAPDVDDAEARRHATGMMGGGIVDALAGRLGIGAGNTGKLLAMLAPIVIGALGKLGGGSRLTPTRLTSLLSDGAGAAADAAPGGRAGLAGLLGPLAGVVGLAGSSAATASPGSTSAAAATGGSGAPQPAPRGAGRLPLIIGAALVALIVPPLLAQGCGAEGGGSTSTTAGGTTVTDTTGAATDTTPTATAQGVQFAIGGDGKVTLTGAVPDEATRTAVVDAAKTAFGADMVIDNLTVDAAAPATDGNMLAKVIDALKGAGNGWTVALTGANELTLSGEVASDEVRQKVLAAAADAFAPGTVIDQMTVAAAGGAGTGTPSAADTAAVDAINREIRLRGVTFVTGSADLTPPSRATLNRVAALLKQAPAVRAEVQGHTDNQGAPAANLALSTSRAKAVVAYLATRGIAGNRLVAKGYGQTKPVAPNGTEAGRAKNRRVVFKVLA